MSITAIYTIAPMGRLGKLPRIPFVQLGPLPYGNFDMKGRKSSDHDILSRSRTSLFDEDHPLVETNTVKLVTFLERAPSTRIGWETRDEAYHNDCARV
jgi:hypothetical protein